MFYGVCGGPRAGVYKSWDEAKKCSIGVKGALCKKFPDQSSAEAFAFPGRATASCSTAGVVEAYPLPATPARSALAASAPAASAQAALPHAVAAAPASSEPAPGGGVYIKVPFDQKNEAKALGAKWDPGRKKWYAPSKQDLARLSKWSVAGPDEVVERPAQLDKVPEFVLSAEDKKVLAAVNDKFLLYTDGSCLGNFRVAEKSNPAGWGVVVVGSMGSAGKEVLLYELFGHVELNVDAEFFLGAEVASNNTGELCGICEALLWLRDWEPSSRPAVICYDSEYAAKTTSGEFNANKNKRLVKSAFSLLEEVRRKREVTLKHVKGHSGHHWNEAVDRLAKRGAAGERCREGRFRPRVAKRTAEDTVVLELPAAKRLRPDEEAA